jgi:hypothetical protein
MNSSLCSGKQSPSAQPHDLHPTFVRSVTPHPAECTDPNHSPPLRDCLRKRLGLLLIGMTLVGIALVGIGTTLAGTTLTSNEGPDACALVVVVLRAIASALRALLARFPRPRDFLGRSLRLPRAQRHSDVSHAAVLRSRQLPLLPALAHAPAHDASRARGKSRTHHSMCCVSRGCSGSGSAV